MKTIKEIEETLEGIDKRISGLSTDLSMMALLLTLMGKVGERSEGVNHVDLDAEVRVLKRRLLREIDKAKESVIEIFEKSSALDRANENNPAQ